MLTDFANHKKARFKASWLRGKYKRKQQL